MKLFNYNEKEYGEDYKTHLLQQWVTCVEMSNSTSERRINVNNFFITLNVAILAFITYKLESINYLLSISGIILCVFWLINIENYRKLNEAKYNVINEIEQSLPIRAMNCEWELIGKGKDKKKFKAFTKLEKYIPYLFVILYSFSILYPFVVLIF